MGGTEQLRDVLVRLLGIGRELTGASASEGVLERILDTAIDLTGAQRGFLCLAHDGELVIEVARNLDQEAVLNARDKLSQSIVTQVMETGEPLASIDAGEDNRLSDSASIRKMGIRSVACIPFKLSAPSPEAAEGTKPEIIGCVYVDHRWQTGQFLDQDLELLELFGTHAALAIRNARYISLLRERNAQLSRDLDTSARALDETRSLLRDEVATQTQRYDIPGIVYASGVMHEVLGLVDRVAGKDLPIQIAGESGTGKERLAQAIHALSGRKGDFVAVNCGAISPELFESELFGHKRGAFTGADRDRTGLIEAAHGGTLFLDEISELPFQHQVKMLRVLQEGEIRRVGEHRPRTVDFRVISASNKDLNEEVAAGRFREDLYYRLRVFHIELPALRERLEDIPVLTDLFAEKLSEGRQVAVDAEVYGLLATYAWPGNVRELENEIRRGMALAEDRFTTALLSPHIGSKNVDPADDGGPRKLNEVISAIERQVIERTLREHQGNKSKTARHLGISRNGLDIKMRRLGLS